MGPISWILFSPVIAFFVLLLVPGKRPDLVRRVASIAMLIAMCLGLYVISAYDRSAAGYQFVDSIAWVPVMGINFTLGVDGISAVMVLLTTILGFAAVLVSYSIPSRVKEHYLFLLMLIAGVTGVFSTMDMFFFYFFYELVLIPMFPLIGIWGSGDKNYATMKLTLYLTLGAVLALVGLIYLYNAAGLNTFDIVALQEHFRINPLPKPTQVWLFLVILLGFGVLVPLWPFHTWSPVGYAAAPISTSMLHAGVLKKLGAYALIRLAIPILPVGAQFWLPFVASVCIMNILYCGYVAMTQKDLKFIIGYSTASHMGYFLLGLACLNQVGMTGAVLLMFAHGVMAALAFALVGAFYDQIHTRDLPDLGGMAKKAPFVATCFVIAALASAGLPGFANFVSELMIFAAAWEHYRIQAVAGVFGIVLTATYMLRAVRTAFFGELSPKCKDLRDRRTAFERLPFVILTVVLLAVGVWPRSLVSAIEPSTARLLDMVHQQTAQVELAQTQTGPEDLP
ncbi:MAG: NADH-quinone oxidoreductase subunit M [Candidatus Omnitrophica bacterium]|nr:NADH-quinone oxidoreductase subunit M [Candidatus Omnitrophota bacterium]